LLNKSKSDIEKNLTDFVENTSENDTLLVYYSGHGFVNNENELYISTKDTNLNNLESTSMSIKSFVETIKLSKSKQKIVVVDSCYSGLIHKVIKESDLYGSNGERLYVISSSSGNEPSYYPINSKNSPTYFTGELIKVLTNGIENGKGSVSLNEIYRNIKLSLKEQDLPSPQKTNINSYTSIFVNNYYIEFEKSVTNNPFLNIFITISLLVNSFSKTLNNEIS
jgi:hypothetical protein